MTGNSLFFVPKTFEMEKIPINMTTLIIDILTFINSFISMLYLHKF